MDRLTAMTLAIVGGHKDGIEENELLRLMEAFQKFQIDSDLWRMVLDGTIAVSWKDGETEPSFCKT